MQHLRNRASFTKALHRVCQRLDTNACISMDFDWHGIPCHSQFRLKALWVAGSYARGASHCGDLDLLADIAVDSGPCPPSHMVANALYGSPKGVRLYLGTPKASTSEVTFDEARLLWSGPGCDWRVAIAAIPVDATATHFARPTDCIPLRPEQLNFDEGDLDDWLALHQQGIIDWSFEPIGTPDVQTLSADEQELVDVISRVCGKRTQALLPHLLAYWRTHCTWPQPMLRFNFTATSFGIGGAKVLVGRPRVNPRDLNSLAVSELLVVPHRSARGPNGVWCIQRGANHPLVLATAGLRAWCLSRDGVQPEFYQRRGVNDKPVDVFLAHGLDLFTTLKAAQDWVNLTRPEEAFPLCTKELTPQELLACLARVDVASIDLEDFALTRCGQVALDCAATASTQQVLTALGKHTTEMEV